MGSFYRSRHELVLVFRHGSDSYDNNVQLGRVGRNRSNVREYHGITSSFGRATEEGNLLALHPTSSRSRWWRMRSSTARLAVISCSIASSAAAPA